jgi:hypothetical protein
MKNLFNSLCLAGALALPFTGVVAAEGIPWDRLTPEQQQLLLQVHQDRWNAMSSQQQERMLRGAERWQKMTPEERRRVQERRAKFKAMSPQERAQLRERFRARREAFERLPPERQKAIRECKQRRRAGEDVDCRNLWPDKSAQPAPYPG